jgi:hypothetical protein
MSPFKNVYGLGCKMKHEFKSAPKTKNELFGSFLVLVFYNNINY